MKRCVSNCHLNERPASWLRLFGTAKPNEMKKHPTPTASTKLSPSPMGGVTEAGSTFVASLLGLGKILWKFITFLGYTFYLARCKILSAFRILYLNLRTDSKFFVKHLRLKMWLLYESVRAAITKYPKLGGLHHRSLFSHHSGGQNSNIRMPSGLASVEASLPGM